MYKLALALAISFCGSACSDPPAYSVNCSSAPAAADGTTIVCVGGDDNSGANVAAPAQQLIGGDAGASGKATCDPYAATGPWIRTDGAPALFAKFAAPSDGREWATMVAADTLSTGDEIGVVVQQAGSDWPIAPATLALEVYDNTEGWSMVHETLDNPSDEPHKLAMRLDAVPPIGSSVKVVMQAPTSAAGEDAALWILSGAMVDPACP